MCEIFAGSLLISVFSLIDALIPKDRSSRRIARNLPYGPGGRRALDIYAPRSHAGSLPVIVFFYGGAWSDGSKDYYAFAGRALAAMGYIVVVPDYRVLPEVEYPGLLSDCADAVAWVVGNIAAHGGDPDRLVLAGHSAGAYNAAMLLLDPQWLQARGHAERIKALVGLSGPYDFFPFDGPISLRVFGAVRNPALTQPVNHVRHGLPPAFLGTGGEDRLVLARNATSLGRALTEAGGVARVRIYAELRHAGVILALSPLGRWLAPVREEIAAFLRDVL